MSSTMLSPIGSISGLIRTVERLEGRRRRRDALPAVALPAVALPAVALLAVALLAVALLTVALPTVALLLSRLAAGRHPEEHESQGHVHLGCRQAGAVRVHQRIDHVLDQVRDRGRSRVGDRQCGAAQHGMAHARDLEYRHALYMACTARAVNRFARYSHRRHGLRRGQAGGRCQNRDPTVWGEVLAAECQFRYAAPPSPIGSERP